MAGQAPPVMPAGRSTPGRIAGLRSPQDHPQAHRRGAVRGAMDRHEAGPAQNVGSELTRDCA
jgi:hypothetical protein